jgi:uncharacterized protein (TIGR02246 family)
MATDEQEIRGLVATWHKSTEAGNVDAVLRLMADDVVFLVAGHPPMQGREAFEQSLRALLATHRIASEFDVVEIKVSGELAYCWTRLTVRIAPLSDGIATIRAGNALSILHKQSNGAWVVVRDANLLSSARDA